MEVSISSWRRWSTLAPATCWSSTTAVVRTKACVGDLIALETKLAGLAGIVIWGLHRDTPELVEIGLPMFSLGGLPTGPLRADEREADALLSARVGRWLVTADDVAMSDENG